MRREPDALDAARVLALVLLAVAAAGGLAAAGAPAPIVMALQQGAFVAAPLLYARWARLPPLASSGFRRMSWRQTGLVLLASVASMWLLKGVVDAQPVLFRVLGLEQVTLIEERALQRNLEQTRSRGWLATFSLLVLLPPFCEEMFFRGIVFRGLAARFRLPLALLATALLFSAAHQTVVQKLLMLGLGIFWGVLVWLTGSLWASILAHALNNLSVLLLTSYFGAALPSMRASPAILLLSAGVFILALRLLHLERGVQGAGGGPP